MLKVAVVDDHALFRNGIRLMLAPHHRSIELVEEGENGEDALRIAREHEPHVMLLDLDMPGMSGLEVTRRIVASGLRVRILIVTMHAEAPFPRRLLEAGAMGYLSKSCSAEELLLAIKRVASGRRYLQADLAQEMALGARGTGPSPFTSLSKRELDICFGLVNGLRPRTLAQQLGLSVKTISTYKLRLFEKLGVSSVAELTRMAINHGLIKAVDEGNGQARTDERADDEESA